MIMADEHGNAAPTLKVWDLPTRVFHWSLVAFSILAWITSEADGALFWLHLWAGYAVMGLATFRLIWGVIGTRHARFTAFIRSWPDVRSHIRKLLSPSPAPSLGHTPPGGWMIALLLVVLILLVATGLFAGDDEELGPFALFVSAGLADALGEIHEGLNGLLWTLVVFHVCAVFAVSWLTRDSLVRAMWTGRKINPDRFPPQDGNAPPADIPPAGWLRTGLAVLLAASLIGIVAL